MPITCRKMGELFAEGLRARPVEGLGVGHDFDAGHQAVAHGEGEHSDGSPADGDDRPGQTVDETQPRGPGPVGEYLGDRVDAAHLRVQLRRVDARSGGGLVAIPHREGSNNSIRRRLGREAGSHERIERSPYPHILGVPVLAWCRCAVGAAQVGAMVDVQPAEGPLWVRQRVRIRG